MTDQISTGRQVRRRTRLAAPTLSALLSPAAVLAAGSGGDAPRQVCGDPAGIQPLARTTRVRLCDVQAIGRAVAKVGAPKVTLAYHARYSDGRMG